METDSETSNRCILASQPYFSSCACACARGKIRLACETTTDATLIVPFKSVMSLSEVFSRPPSPILSKPGVIWCFQLQDTSQFPRRTWAIPPIHLLHRFQCRPIRLQLRPSNSLMLTSTMMDICCSSRLCMND